MPQAARPRTGSPWTGCSILTTSAPHSASTAGAAGVTPSLSVTDQTGDVMDLANNVAVSGRPEVDISSASASDKDGRIVLTMTTGGADDLTAASFAMWGLYTTSTDPEAPDFVV